MKSEAGKMKPTGKDGVCFPVLLQANTLCLLLNLSPVSLSFKKVKKSTPNASDAFESKSHLVG